MRTLLKVTLDVVAGNKAIMEGSLSKVIKSTMERINPEASYFLAAEDGCRSCFMVFDLKDPSEIPVIAEPLYMAMNAKVTFTPVMNAEELQKGLQNWQQSQSQ
ncbi:MAG: hypothetical protein JWQ09_3204 [Segetibacter sp.]|nr:hypothetical protein [Segetibacter sp.]